MPRRIFLIALAIIGMCVAYTPALRLVLIPLRVHLSWVHDLATWRSGLAQMRELPPARIATQFGEIPVPVRDANEQKLALFEAYNTRTGQVGLRRRYSTVEGQEIIVWLLTDHGEAEYIHDATRDSWGGSPGVDRHRITKITRGFFRNDTFIVGEPDQSDSVVVVLRLEESRSNPFFFY